VVRRASDAAGADTGLGRERGGSVRPFAGVAYFTHRFEGPIARHAVGTLRYTVVYLPASLAATLPFAEHPRLRIEADVGGVPIRGAWQPSPQGRYLMLPRAFLRTHGFAVGDVVEVAFRIDAQDAVEIPPELSAVLAARRPIARAWAERTPGVQRGMAHRIASAKKPETRAARLAEVVEALRTGAHFGPPTRARGSRAR
jgi:hypothetical protein